MPISTGKIVAHEANNLIIQLNLSTYCHEFMENI